VVSLRLLPLGGFCAFEGEDADVKSEGAFNAQKPWKRIIVLVSGALFNFVSAVLICVLLFCAYGENVAVVNNVYDYAPSFNQQLQQGDIIYKINGKNVFVLDNISRYMPDDDQEMTVTVIKPNGEIQTYEGVKRQTYYSFYVTALNKTFVSDGRELAVGDMIYKIDGKSLYRQGDLIKYLEEASETCVVTVVSDAEYVYEIATSDLRNAVTVQESSYSGIGMGVRYATHKFSFGTALSRVLPYCGEVAMLVLRTLGGLFTGAVGLKDIGGPITTISVTSQIVSYGFASVLSLIVLISVNLAVFNLLPVPALDGCRIVFVIIEWIAGKPINRKVEGWINTIGLFVLLGFVILVDLLKL
ncbi:MAG: RIP metalloprotease RseP, partial [Candidatus Fimimonas sp.]